MPRARRDAQVEPPRGRRERLQRRGQRRIGAIFQRVMTSLPTALRSPSLAIALPPSASAKVDRKSVVSGTSVSVRVDLGGRRIIHKKDSSHIHFTLSILS